METEERSFPLTKLNSEVVAVAKTRESVPQNKGLASHTDVHEKRRFTLSKVLKKIVTAFGKSAESRQYYFLARSSDKDTDDSESDTELDSCSLSYESRSYPTTH